MTQTTQSLLLNIDPKDPDHKIVSNFHSTYFPEKRSEGMSEEEFEQAKDQIIHGWVVRNPIIPEEKMTYYKYGEFFIGSMAAIYIKGQNFQKVIYCQWDSDTTFYCPEVFESEVVFCNSEFNPDTYLANRFYSNREFYYCDEAMQTWKKLLFRQYSRMEENKFVDVTLSTGCLLYK